MNGEKVTAMQRYRGRGLQSRETSDAKACHRTGLEAFKDQKDNL